MTEASTMKLYALAITAMRTADNQTAIGVQSVVALLAPGGDIQHDGLEAARSIFPESEGWFNHFVNTIEVTQDFPLGLHYLTWQVKGQDNA
jgi:hypothetical protein